jgi:WD40 repeat protein
MCMGGHRDPIYGTAFSPDGKYLATASEDSTVRIWLVQSHKLVATLSEGMDTNYECLRVAWMKITNDNDSNVQQNDNGYLLASGGADGVVRLWSGVENTEQQLEWQCVGSLNHFVEDDEERPQIYALQFIQSPSYPNTDILLTSAHDSVYLWTIESEEESAAESPPPYQPRKFLSLLSIQFSHLEDGTQTYQFGGSRNPENELYVFDASYSESNDLLAAALSDGTCRVLSLAASNNIDEDENIQREQCVLSLPPGYFGGRGGHLTAVEWDSSGTRLATCVASGRVILWYLQNVGVGDSISLRPSVVSILDGGSGRQVFGAKYCCGKNEDLLLTWGIEGKVSVWDSFSVGEVMSPICTLISHADYPIFALDVTQNGTKQSIAVGGGKEGGFLGVPAYIYDI